LDDGEWVLVHHRASQQSPPRAADGETHAPYRRRSSHQAESLGTGSARLRFDPGQRGAQAERHVFPVGAKADNSNLLHLFCKKASTER
jgi:hypothetical protein